MEWPHKRKPWVIAFSSLCALTIFAWGLSPSVPAADDAKPLAQAATRPNALDATRDADWDHFQKTVQPFLTSHCITCHGDDNPEAGLQLNHFSSAMSMERGEPNLAKVLAMLQSRKMPPKDEVRPSEDEYRSVTSFLQTYTEKVDLVGPRNPGHVTIRRLNRAEYNNTIHDLLGIDFNPADGFPVDEAGYGFDNNGDVLSMAPVLLDKYLNAAAQSLDRAIMVDPSVPPTLKRWDDVATLPGTVPPSDPTAHSADRGPFDHPVNNGRVFQYSGEIYADYNFPATGTYFLRIRPYGTAGSATKARPSVVFKLDGQTVDKPFTVNEDQRSNVLYSSKPVKVTAGTHRVTVAFVNGATAEEYAAAIAPKPPSTQPGGVMAATAPTTTTAVVAQGTSASQGGAANRGAVAIVPPPLDLPGGATPDAATTINQQPASPIVPPANATALATTNPTTNPAGARGQRGNGAGAANGRNGAAGAAGRRGGGPPPAAPPSPTGKPILGIIYMEVEGPQEISPVRMPDSFKNIFVAWPSATVTKQDAARAIISNFATRAYRRPVPPDELNRLLAYWTQIDAGGDTFDHSIDLALQPILASPNFIYRVETDPTAADPGGVRTVNEFELASRLSYFIWSSMPDDELFGLARDGKLRANLPAQVKRMLASPKAAALVDNFGGQWLQLRQMANVVPDAKRFPDFDEPLRAAMTKETSLFFQAIIHEDRSVLDFIDADYTFMNGRLAKHYGRTDITGDEFRRVSLVGDARGGGLLTQASILTITSYPNRTSPVLRGKWVLENLLDEAPPPPPPDVPKLAETSQAEMTGTLRQRMEQHRTNPNCVSCHAQMDPIGFGLENFDAIGAWRVNDLNNVAIDASGTLPDGTNFEGAAGLKKVLMTRKDQFCRCLTDRLMTFALGRGMEGYDRASVNEIAAGLKTDNYKFSSLVMRIVNSDAFQKRGSSESK